MSKVSKKREVCNYCHSILDVEINKHRETCQAFKAAVRKSKQAKEEENNPFIRIDGKAFNEHAKEGDNNNNHNNNNYYNLNEGAITFGGGKQGGNLSDLLKREKPNSPKKETNNNYWNKPQDENEFNPIVKKNQTIKPYVPSKGPAQTQAPIPSFVKEYDTNDKFVKDTGSQEKSMALGIINNIGDNNSFLSVVVQTFWNLEFIRNYIIYDLNVKESENNSRLLYHLKVRLNYITCSQY